MLPLGASGFDGFCFDFAVIESGRSDSLVHAIRGKDGRWPRVVAPCADMFSGRAALPSIHRLSRKPEVATGNLPSAKGRKAVAVSCEGQN